MDMDKNNGNRTITFADNSTLPYYVLRSDNLSKPLWAWQTYDSSLIQYITNGATGQKEGKFIDNEPLNNCGFYKIVDEIDKRNLDYQRWINSLGYW